MKKPMELCDREDINDPGYSKKYAQHVPPLEAYFFIPNKKDGAVQNMKTTKARHIFFGWNNLSDFERQGAQQLK